jgi:hypothetical protein
VLHVVVIVALAVLFPSLAGAATHQFGTTAPGGSFGCPSGNFKYGNKYQLGEYGAVTKITGWMKGAGGAGTQSFRTMIYAADGSGGGPGTLLLTSATVNVAGDALEGAVDFPVSPAVPLAPGDYWVAQQSGPSDGVACLSGAGSGLNNFNSDSFSDGPSNPFDASGPISSNSNTWTLSVTYETDETLPTITASASPPANANGWNNTNVTVTFTCIDNAGGSGVDSVTPPTVLSSEGPNQSATGTCKDKAGNVASVTKTGISIDKTNPTILFGSHAPTYTVDQNVSFTCTASDALSGLASTTCGNVNAPAWTFGVGPHTITASTIDKAGNSATASTSVTVQVTAAGICNLTKQFVQGSAKYQALNAKTKQTVDAIWAAACTCINSVTAKLSPSQKAQLITLYKSLISKAATDGWLTAAQASTLMTLASAF